MSNLVIFKQRIVDWQNRTARITKNDLNILNSFSMESLVKDLITEQENLE